MGMGVHMGEGRVGDGQMANQMVGAGVDTGAGVGGPGGYDSGEGVVQLLLAKISSERDQSVQPDLQPLVDLFGASQAGAWCSKALEYYRQVGQREQTR